MKNKLKNILVLILVLAVLLAILSACTYEELGLPVSKNMDTGTTAQEAGNGSQLSGEELFLEMKAKQDKNPLSDINVRKAILYAVDRKRIVEEVFGGYNNVSNSLFAESSPFWDPVWSEYEFDLNKASEFLKKAGYGPENPLYITISAVNNISSRKLIEEIIKVDLEKIGINLWIYNDDPKEFYQNYVYNGNFDLGIWSLYIPGIDELTYSFSSGKIPSMETEENRRCENFYWYSNTNIDDLLMHAGITDDIEMVREDIEKLQETLAKDAVILPLFNRLFVFAYDDNLKKVDIETMEDRIFYKIEEWLLPDDLEIAEGDKSEITIGYESDNIDMLNGFKPYFINDLLFKGLWKKEIDGSYTPELAASFTDFEEDMDWVPGQNITITLKDGIYWQDGDPVTSEDIKYTFEYFKNFMEEKEYFSNLDEDYAKIKDIAVQSEKSFTIVFGEPVDEWQKLFTQVFKKDQFEYGSYDAILYNKLISNGPYKITDYDASGQMTLEINEYYYNKIPEIERLVIKFDPDIHNLIAMLKEGEINFLSIPVDPELMHMLEDENDMKLVIKEGNLIEHLALSLKPKGE